MKNSMKNNIAFIIFQCCSIIICCNAIICAITQCMAIIKKKTTYILFIRSSIMCNKSFLKRKKREKTMKKRRKKKRPKVNLIFSHVNHTFWISNLQIGPKALNTLVVTLKKNVFLMWRRVQFKVQFASNWSLGF